MCNSVVDSVRMSVRGIRQEWNDRFPKWRVLQAFLTWLIDYPVMGQKPLFANKPWWVAVSIRIIVLTRSLIAAFASVSVGGHALWLLQIHPVVMSNLPSPLLLVGFILH